MTETPYKKCSDCKWHARGHCAKSEVCQLVSPPLEQYHLGLRPVSTPVPCADARSNKRACGPDARFFMAKAFVPETPEEFEAVTAFLRALVLDRAKEELYGKNWLQVADSDDPEDIDAMREMIRFLFQKR